MAIAVEVPSTAKSTPSGTVDPQSQHNPPSFGLITDAMSYQYPPPSQSGADMDLPQASYIANYPTSAAASMEVRNKQTPKYQPTQPLVPAQDTVISLSQRRESLSRALKLKRSQSTPNVRQQGMNESDHLSLQGEKRRNKLGYHRTSVACGHCRRRKIRCIPQQADLQGRCQNCIRLKKDCSFFPVEQQPSTAAGQSSASRSSLGGSKLASATSSPALGHPPEGPSHSSYQQLNSTPSLQSMGPPSIKASDHYTADPKLPSSASSSRTFEYGANMSNWLPPDASPGSAKPPSDVGAAWRSYPHESPVTPAFSPYTPHAPQASTAAWANTAAAPGLGGPMGGDAATRPDDVAWAPYPGGPATRSFSYGGEREPAYPSESHIPRTASTGGGGGGGNFHRKSSMPSDLYPSPIVTAVSSMGAIPGPAIDPHGSLSAGAAPPPHAGYGAWTPQSYAYNKPEEGYEGWYDGSGQPDPQISPEGEQPPPNVYYGTR